MFRLIISGSRTMPDTHEPAVQRVFNQITSLFHVFWSDLTVLHGAARGVDMMADHWCDWEGIDRIAFPARWRNFGGAIDHGAGIKRNVRMLNFGAHGCLAVVDKPLSESRGTAHMVQIARAHNLPTFVYQIVDADTVIDVTSDLGRAHSVL